MSGERSGPPRERGLLAKGKKELKRTPEEESKGELIREGVTLRGQVPSQAERGRAGERLGGTEMLRGMERKTLRGPRSVGEFRPFVVLSIVNHSSETVYPLLPWRGRAVRRGTSPEHGGVNTQPPPLGSQGFGHGNE